MSMTKLEDDALEVDREEYQVVGTMDLRMAVMMLEKEIAKREAMHGINWIKASQGFLWNLAG